MRDVSARASLAEKAPTLESSTPETYLGYARTEGFSSPESLVADRAIGYTAPAHPGNGEWGLGGTWTVSREYITPEGPGELSLGFDAKNVFLVVEPQDNTGRIRVFVDGKPGGGTEDVTNGLVVPEESRLYQLVELDKPGEHVLDLKVQGNVRLFAFTFG